MSIARMASTKSSPLSLGSTSFAATFSDARDGMYSCAHTLVGTDDTADVARAMTMQQLMNAHFLITQLQKGAIPD